MTPRPRDDAAQMRLAGAVIAIAMLVWLAANLAGRHYGWDDKWAFLFDLAAIAAFVWSLAVTWRIWRRRND